MRGKKAKALRKHAELSVRHGLKIGIHAPKATQRVSDPCRCLYQALKGRRIVSVIGEGL